MSTLPVVTSSINDIDAFRNTGDITVNLLNHFDDPFTTGLVASFNLDSSTVNNLNNVLENSNLVTGTTNVLLFDQEGQGAPLTVQNFLNYVNDGDYVNTIIHRSVPGFVIQGGGFTAEGLADNLDNPPNAIGVIPTDPPVVNEFSSERSNLRGTIAMAKLNGDPDSATNQWFFNLDDANAVFPVDLDNQNGGFTVFGEVLGQSDLDILDTIASIEPRDGRIFFGQDAFKELPLILDDPNQTPTGDEDFVRYSNITVAQGSELTFTVENNSNPSLVNAIISNNQLVLDDIPDQVGTAEITIRATDLAGDFVEDTFSVTIDDSVDPTMGPLDTAFFRFQNSHVPGTYLYATGAEAQNIRDNFPVFVEEGVAFNAAIEPNDELIIPLYRFQNNQLPGTYLFVGEQERNSINADPNFSSTFTEEGIAFYVYGAGANEETAFSRFQNSNILGTYLYAAGGEADNIRNNFPGFIDEGIAFEATI